MLDASGLLKVRRGCGSRAAFCTAWAPGAAVLSPAEPRLPHGLRVSWAPVPQACPTARRPWGGRWPLAASFNLCSLSAGHHLLQRLLRGFYPLFFTEVFFYFLIPLSHLAEWVPVQGALC